MRKTAATLENIHTCFEKEAATASIPNDILSMRGAAATLKKINTFFENSELLGASTKILPMGGGRANPDGSKTSAYGSGHYQNTISLFSFKILNKLKNTTNNIYKLQKDIVPEMDAG
jgi:hypothetical protein